MKNFTKLFALGILAITTGISSAQTYTATAGTAGSATAATDHSIATGDGASVSVDVPLEFELPKKVAITAAANGTSVLPASPLFDGIQLYVGGNGTATKTTLILDSTPASWDNNVSGNNVHIAGGIYSNTAVSITADSTDFIHESDSNSILKARKGFRVGAQNSSVYADSIKYGSIYDDGDSSTSVFPVNFNLDDTALMSEGNKFGWLYWSHVYLDTIDPTDRAGKYTSIATITVSTL